MARHFLRIAPTANAVFPLLLLLLFSQVIKSSAESQCSEPPAGCSLNCPSGFVKAAPDQCLCMCRQALLTCFGLSCKDNEKCVNVNGNVGCAPVAPVGSQMAHQLARPIVPSAAISSVRLGPRDQLSEQQSGLVGECPALVSGNCDVQCRTDTDCPGEAGLRCCPNGCGRQCVPTVNVVPIQSHLAIRPLMRPAGREKGAAGLVSDPLLAQCGAVKCSNSLYECQLLESDCDKPPCPTVPKCLINPCPVGSPMKLANGVTALCKRQSQCWDSFWCHQPKIASPLPPNRLIGYNGLGFCCSGPRRPVRPGSCRASKRRVEAREQCTAECNADEDCAEQGTKCCFDGCGLSCRRPVEAGGIGAEEAAETTEERNTKTKKKGGRTELSAAAAAECPLLAEYRRPDCQPGRDQCSRDVDCPGRLKCCSDGCFMRCTRISVERGQTPAEAAEENLVKMEGPPAGEEEEDGQQPAGAEGQQKLGQCPQMAEGSRRFCPSEGGISADKCQADGDCPGLQKCCRDECGARTCLFPALTSHHCLALRAAAQVLAKLSRHNRLFQPKCDHKGHFLPVQSRSGTTWCVDAHQGQEVAGTRAPSEQFAGCERRRICPVLSCSLQCPFGHQMDGLGCPQCICRDPVCRAVQCPEGNVCRMVVANSDGCRQSDRSGPGQQTSQSASSCLVPQCVLNTCLQGEPLEEAESGALVRCDEQRAQKCPPGFYCNKLGIGDSGYCCSGLVLQSELIASARQCPAMPNLVYKQQSEELADEGSRRHALGCRLSKECPHGKLCCFNGRGSECTAFGAEEGGGTDEAAEKKPVEEGKALPGRKSSRLGSNDGDAFVPMPTADAQQQCPARLRNASNPGCVSNCLADSDCAGRSALMRCCPLGCGQQCAFPNRLGPCAHLLASALREVDKLAGLAQQSAGRPTVQCTREGLFQPVQFDAISGQYWCVDESTGQEQLGTRISSSPIGSALPDCSIQHRCKVAQCPQERMARCEHGPKLDHRGCPADERCECRNPCDDFKCALPASEICLLKRVNCLELKGGDGSSGTPCPSVPTCVKNVCRLARLEVASPRLCRTESSDDCGSGGEQGAAAAECRLFTDQQQNERIGICCRGQERQLLEQPLVDSSASSSVLVVGEGTPHTAESGHQPRQGICPAHGRRPGVATECRNNNNECARDSQCAGIQKCCPGADGCRSCVQPMLATNCQNLASALQALEAAHGQHFVPQPNCDPRKGNTFAAVQCDGQAYCWCVDDPLQGRPMLGTRRLQPAGEDFCSERKACAILCPQRRLLECPFGVDIDLDGCPLSSDCRCRSLCEQVRCPEGQICTLRPRDCAERERDEQSRCLPVPTCEPSPCGASLQPALGPVSKQPLSCQPGDREQLCPSGFQCARPLQQQQWQAVQGGVCCPLAADEEEERRREGEQMRATGEQQQQGKSGEASPDSVESHECIPAAGNECHLPMLQGRRERCDQGMELRFFFDYSEQSCQEFVYAGCGGNANNFRARDQCEHRCLANQSGPEPGMEQFEMGFKLVSNRGDKNGAEADEMLESSLRSYLTAHFGLQEGQIRDVHFDRDSSSVGFGIIAPEARKRAKSISNALASGQFQFSSHGGRVYRAESDNWFARQVSALSADGQGGRPSAGSALFWVVLTACICFALVVLLALCCGYTFLRDRSRRSASSGASVCFSPSPQQQVGAIQHHWSPLLSRKEQATLSPEEIQRMRANAAGGGAAHLLTPMPPSSTSSPSASNSAQTSVAPKVISEEMRRVQRREGKATTTTMFY